LAIVPTLTSDGFTAPRGADYLDTIRTTYETETGLTPEWDNDEVIGVLSAIQADQLDQVSQVAQAGYDARRRATATGIQLDDIGTLIGVLRQDATHSRDTLTVSGVNGTYIPAGFLVQGGGTNGDERWATLTDITIAAGTGTAIIEAVNEGAIVATAATITTIVTPKNGVTSVTNAGATPGVARETDSAYRVRQQASLQIAGSASVNAIRAKLVQKDYIDSAIVIENDDSIYQTIEGIYMDPNSIEVVLWPDTLTVAEKEEVGELIYTHCPAGTKTLGAVGAIVTKADGVSKTIYWDWASTHAIPVVFVTTPEAGYVLADYKTALEDAVTAFFAGLTVGQGVTLLDMYYQAASILDTNTQQRMIKSTTVTIHGAAADFAGVATVLVELSAVTVS